MEKNSVPTGDVIKDWDIREDEKIYFLLRSEKNKFTIGLGDILECLRFAEKEGEVPKLPVEWWGSEYGQTIMQRKQRLCNSADSKEKYSKWRIHIEYITKDSKKGVAIMIYSVNYMNLTEKINSFKFVKYLTDTGWPIYPTKRKKIKIFQLKKDTGKRYQVTIPLDKIFSDWISITHDYYQSINDAVEKMRKNVNRKTKIIGKVKKLESVPDISQRTSGKATIVYLDENDMERIISSNLDKENYNKAIKAHSLGSYVEIVGDIRNTGKRNVSIQCETFDVVN